MLTMAILSPCVSTAMAQEDLEMYNVGLQQSIDEKIQTRLSFDDSTDLAKADVGTSPTKVGTITSGQGKNGGSAIFAKGKNYLDFSEYIKSGTTLKNKSISFSIKSNKAVAQSLDPAILSNKNWDGKDSGFVFSYSYSGNNKYKLRIDDGLFDSASHPGGRVDYDATTYTVDTWSDYVMTFTDEYFLLYKDGELQKKIEFSGINEGYMDSSVYSLKLGNDGTGAYSKNDTVDYEFSIDNFLITSTPLTDEEVNFIHNPPLSPDEVITGTITGEDTIPRSDVEIIRTYKAQFLRENGTIMTDYANVSWSIENGGDITIPDSAVGNMVTVTVPANSVQESLTLVATYTASGHEPVEIRKEISTVQAGIFPESVKEKIETHLLFSQNITDETGNNTPTQKGTALTYTTGRSGKSDDKAIVLKKGGGYLDFAKYIAGQNTLSNKSIAFSMKSNVAVAAQKDPAILSNKDWNKNDKGFVFAYSYGGNNKYKMRLDDGTFNATSNKDGRNDYDATVYSVGVWHDYVMNFDAQNNKWSLYKNGKLEKETDTSKMAAGWMDSSAYSLKLGNDGTGVYAVNTTTDFECAIDNFLITDLLTHEEISALANAYSVDTGKKIGNIKMVGTEKAAADAYYNVNLYGFGSDLSSVGSVEFDVVYDTNFMSFYKKQFDSSTTIVPETGKVRVTSKKEVKNSSVKMYSDTRMIQLVFELADVPQNTDTAISIQNIAYYDKDGNIMPGVTATPDDLAVTICSKDSMDLNGDGVVGAGDVSLATTLEQKEAIASAAAIYPYKRAVAITIDGAGRVWDEKNAIYNGTGMNSSSQIVPGIGLEKARNNPYCMDFFNNEMAMSLSAISENPPISAQNYCSITHGADFASKLNGTEYGFDNTKSGQQHWPDLDKTDAKFPSMLKAVHDATPNRKLYAYAEWSPIINGILEPDAGIYFDYQYGTYCFDRLADYINSGKFKNTALTYMQSDVMDHYGHNDGYFTDGFYKQLEIYDTFLPTIVDAMKDTNTYDDTLLIFNSDHGGRIEWDKATSKTRGYHGKNTNPDETGVFISVGGQTVNKGAKLSGGSNDDIAAIALDGLRLGKPASMSDSTVFDKSMFLSQEELIKNNREIEKITVAESGNKINIDLSNKQADREISTMDIVLSIGDADVPTVNTAGAIVRNSVVGDKLYLTVAYDAEASAMAELVFGSNVDGRVRADEVMLGTTDGSEIYCDLVNQVQKTSVENAHEMLNDTIMLGANTAFNNITSDILLPTNVGGVTVSWESSNNAVIAKETGFVTCGAYNTGVTLTATLTSGADSMTKTFKTTVQGNGFAGNTLLPSGACNFTNFEGLKAAGFKLKDNNKAEYTEETIAPVATLGFGGSSFDVIRKQKGDTNAVKVDVEANITSQNEFTSDVYEFEMDIQQVGSAPLYIATTWPSFLTMDWGANGEINVNAAAGKITGMQNKRAKFNIILDYKNRNVSIYVDGELKLDKIALRSDAVSGGNLVAKKPATFTINVKGDGNVGSGMKLYSFTARESYSLAMASAYNSVDIRNITTENTGAITKDLTLEGSTNDIGVVWTSSNENVISSSGKVTPPVSDTRVTLNATLSPKIKDAGSVVRTYTVLVKGTSSAYLVDADGNTVVFPKGGDSVSATASTTADAQLFMAVYDANGILVEIKSAKGTGTIKTSAVTVPMQGTVRAMLWKDGTMAPLCK